MHSRAGPSREGITTPTYLLTYLLTYLKIIVITASKGAGCQGNSWGEANPPPRPLVNWYPPLCDHDTHGADGFVARRRLVVVVAVAVSDDVIVKAVHNDIRSRRRLWLNDVQ